jgi:hypothetical protein
MKLNNFITKHIKQILIIGVILFLLLCSLLIILNSIKTNVVQKEMQKRFIFCEDKSGRVPYDFICTKSGECQQQYLWCNYLNYLRTQNIADMNNLNYQDINKAYNENFANGSMVVETK